MTNYNASQKADLSVSTFSHSWVEEETKFVNVTVADFLFDGGDSLSPMNFKRVREGDFNLKNVDSVMSLFKNFAEFKQEVLSSQLTNEEQKHVLSVTEADAFSRVKGFLENN